LFKVGDDAKLADLAERAERGDFATVADEKLLLLKGFQKFGDMIEALSEATSLVEGSMGSILEDFLRKNMSLFGKREKLLLADKGLAQSVHKALGIECEGQTTLALESTRFVRNHFAALLPGVAESDITQMNLGLAHSLSRYKLKFSPDKVDTMIVQAVALIDDLDKELNTYAMRAREVSTWISVSSCPHTLIPVVRMALSGNGAHPQRQ
jgi:nucleolar protein 58